jgi:transposase
MKRLLAFALSLLLLIAGPVAGAVAELVGIECGVVSGVFNLELSGIEVPDWRPRHDKHYHEA